MLFNSGSFFIFYLILFALLLSIQQIKKLSKEKKPLVRNGILLIVSYYFYGFLDWRFVPILLFTTLVNYFFSLQIASALKNQEKGKAKKWLTATIILSIGVLAYFKYVGFFIESTNIALMKLGIGIHLNLIKVLLPVGISFFTFQALTYSLDVYKQKIPVHRNIIDVALFISFFPTILSGPIEKARNLLPQLIDSEAKLSLQNLFEGGKLFVWGLFKKMVIADRLADYINIVYGGDPSNHSSITLIATAVFYSFQIYADFSGYSDMAIGIARTFGFRLSSNFHFPYFSTSIKEFWKRWHISLTSWFSEYLYIGMGGNRVSQARWILNISTVFLVSGFWHGANWSFIVWGALHAFYYLCEYYYKKTKVYKGLSIMQNSLIWNFFSAILVIALVSIAWVFFRIENIGQAYNTVVSFFDQPGLFYWGSSAFSTALTVLLLGFFILADWIKYKHIVRSPFLRAVGYAVLLCLVVLLGVSDSAFVYFQF